MDETVRTRIYRGVRPLPDEVKAVIQVSLTCGSGAIFISLKGEGRVNTQGGRENSSRSGLSGPSRRGLLASGWPQLSW